MSFYIWWEDVVPAVGFCDATWKLFGRADSDAGIVGGGWGRYAAVDCILEGGYYCWDMLWFVILWEGKHEMKFGRGECVRGQPLRSIVYGEYICIWVMASVALVR
jgi:hypothetical protein